MLEGAGLLHVVQNRLACRTVEAVHTKDKVVLIQLVELAEITTDCEALAVVDEAVQGLGTLAAGGNRIDSELWSGVHITADKDIVLRGLISNGVCNSVALLAGCERTDIQGAQSMA